MKPHSRRWLAAALALALTGLAACNKAPEPTASPAAANVSDVDVTEHVTTALRAATSLQGADIAVVTLKGDVRMTGMVASQAQIDEALRIARASEGVHAIHDELTIRK